MKKRNLQTTRYIVSYCIYAALTGFTFFSNTSLWIRSTVAKLFISTCALSS